MGSRPWVLHLSYVKPHWPYMAPAPYHAMYSYDQCLPTVRRRESELLDRAPGARGLPAARGERHLRSATRCIRKVRPAYQGLVKQLD